MQPNCTSAFCHNGGCEVFLLKEEDSGSRRVRVLFVFLLLAILVFGYVSCLTAVLADEAAKQLHRIGRALGIH